MDSKECTVLYKILTPSEKDAMPEKAWKGTALDLKDGFIHTSTSEQVSGTLELFFAKDSGVGDSLYLAAIPRKNVKQDELKFEGEGFPHIYGTINPSSDVFTMISIQRNPDTTKFTLDDLLF